MNRFYSFSAVALLLGAAGTMAAFSLSDVNLSSVKSALEGKTNASSVASYTGVPTLEQLKSFAATKEFAPENEDLPKGVTVEPVLNQDFSNWTAGSMENPDAVDVGGDETLLNSLVSDASEWSFYQAYQAGGAMYLGYDEVGDHGPGYVMTPCYDFDAPNVAYRLRVTAMNVNQNVQDQNLQTFFMDQTTADNGQMVAASAVPMEYNEWSVCEWVGQVKSGTKNLRAMILGWQGKVMIKNITFEKLVYALNSPVDIVLGYSGGKLTASWSAVEGAVSYKATAYVVADDATTEIGNVEVNDPSAEWSMAPNEYADRYYVTVVAVDKDGNESYPASNYTTIEPESVGAAEALPATNVSPEGFTANWNAIEDAARTMVFPSQTHKAVEDDFYVILNEEFQNVPLSNNDTNPYMVAPMLGMGNMDLMMSRAGWSSDFCFFFRMMPEMPTLVLSNMYAAYGLPGYVMSPVYDLSVGDGNVYVSGFAMSAADDAVVTFSLVDAATGEEYSSEDVEVTTGGASFDICLAGGKPNSVIKFVITDSAEEDMIVIPMLSMVVEMKDGDVISGPLNTEFVPAPATSFDFEYPVDANNSYSYYVQGVFREILGEPSDVVEVKAAGSGVAQSVLGNGKVSLNGDVLTVLNPDAEKVIVVSADGKVLASSDEDVVTLSAVSGVVLVKVGDKTFKVIR